MNIRVPALAVSLALAAISPRRNLAAISDPVKTADGLVSGVTLSFWRSRLQRHSVCRAARGRPALETAAAGSAWKGVRKADAFGDVCVQRPAPKRVPNNVATDLPDSPKMSEDCLYLNVWTDAKARRSAAASDGLDLRRSIHRGRRIQSA